MILSQEFVNQYKDKQVPWGFGALSYVTYKRCVTIDTLVLDGNLTWRKAGELKEGDSIIGFDENPVQVGRKLNRYYRMGKVMHNSIEQASVMGIELEDGTVLYATHDHPWLVKFDSTVNPLQWRETKDLVATKKGSDVYLVRPFGKPWKSSEDYVSGYLAASFDGEGHADGTNGIVFVQVQNEMLDKVEIFLSERDIPYTKSLKSSIEGRQDCYQLRWYDFKHVVRFLGEVQAPRITRKFLSRFVSEPKQMRVHTEDLVRVVRVFDAGVKDIAVLSTDIATHFTDGFASHNTYARQKDDGTLEEWYETVARCINGAQKIGSNYTEDEAKQLYDYMFNLKAIYAGRMLWQLGTSTVDRYGGASLNNCYYTNIKSIEDFCFIFDLLMLGAGVGYSVRRQDVSEFPKIKQVKITHEKTNDADFILPDKREGWVELLRRVLTSYFNTGQSFSYSTILIRSFGEPIKGFGGVASGPQVLIEGISKICSVLDARAGKKLRSVDALDIANIIGSVVVAGNVRRSAQIAIGDADDYLYLRAKDWSSGNIPNHRAFSNNTIYADSYDYLSQSFWNTYSGSSEPLGLFNLRLSQTQGRIGEYIDDSSVEGMNPCGEVTLADKESCNLAELPLNNISNQEEFIEISKLLYKTQKAVAALPYHIKDTNAIVKKNMRLGLSVTGIVQSINKLYWLDSAYRSLRNYDIVWSKERGYNPSIKLTTIKPLFGGFQMP